MLRQRHEEHLAEDNSSKWEHCFVRHEGHSHRYHVSDVNVHYTHSAHNTFMKKYTKYIIIIDM
jgi:hypothetical protein